MSVPTRRILEPIFGEPTLISAINGDAVWARGYQDSATHQKGGTGWTAKLYGGVQSAWNDWAAIYVPVYELDLVDLKSALWSWYNTEEEAFGVNMVIWIHDPNDNDKRAEMTQQADISTLEKGAGWNAHELDDSVDQFYFYGEGTSGTGLTAAAPNYYGLDDFQADAIFKDWTVYRISYEWGWSTGNAEFKDVWVADIKLNGTVVPLRPDSGGSGRIGRRHYVATTAALDATLSPKTPFRLLSVDAHVSATPNATEAFTLMRNAGRSDVHDTVLFSADLGTLAVTSLVNTFEGIETFGADDDIDIDQLNSTDKNWGVTVTYQTVFEGV